MLSVLLVPLMLSSPAPRLAADAQLRPPSLELAPSAAAAAAAMLASASDRPYQPSSYIEDSRWYGWEILIIDAATWVAVLANVGGSNGTLDNAVGVLYLVGGPFVHWTHGHVGRGFGSLGIRVGAPIVGFVAGLFVGSGDGSSGTGDEGFDTLMKGALGFTIGILAAQILDIALLSHEMVRIVDDGRVVERDADTPAVVLTPVLAPRRDGAIAGVAALF